MYQICVKGLFSPNTFKMVFENSVFLDKISVEIDN